MIFTCGIRLADLYGIRQRCTHALGRRLTACTRRSRLASHTGRGRQRCTRLFTRQIRQRSTDRPGLALAGRGTARIRNTSPVRKRSARVRRHGDQFVDISCLIRIGICGCHMAEIITISFPDCRVNAIFPVNILRICGLHNDTNIRDGMCPVLLRPGQLRREGDSDSFAGVDPVVGGVRLSPIPSTNVCGING